MTSAGHRVVVVEDEPSTRELVCEVLRLRGDEPVEAGTVEEALALIGAGGACCYVFDQQLPLNASAMKALVTGGERIIEAARAVDARHSGKGHVTPILALTGASTSVAFVSGLFKLGIDAFVPKPLSDNLALFQTEIRDMLARAGRDDHAKCAALASPTAKAAPAAASRVRIAIDGKVTTSGRTEIEINGTLRDMQDGKFLVVVRCIVARERNEDGWSSRKVLGIGDDRAAMTRIREAFEGLVPDDFEVLEGDRRRNLRLNREVVVERVNWAALAEHPHAGVQKVAVEQRKRLGQA